MASILILGGTGETGSWFARYFKEKGFDVAVWGPSGKVEVAERLGVRYAKDMMAEVEKSDIVLVSVLIEKTVEIIREVAPHMHPGSLIMDVTSIKSEPVRAMKTYAPKGVEVLGTHPMFGPTMPALRGQTIILTPVEGKTGKWLSIMQSLFQTDGAHVEILDAEEHDEIMAVVQALTHFAYIGIGAALRTLDFDVQRSRRFMSPVYETMIDFVGRILDQNPELYASIQKNPKAAVVRQTFVAECMRLSEKADAGDLEGFKQIMRAAAEHYGETHEALERSDRMINVLIGEKGKS
ncbi:MAG: prephenate dehydrogenase/arogenate dehydrogenase family protein [Methanothrix sp.]|jgi:prephenate dehydrogenase|nr:prephenate dehydrogenase/arogenate dehydrogenase family protein [Methanothrix sp.]